MGINADTPALNPNFKYCQLGKDKFFLLIPHFAKTTLSNSCYCLPKGAKHCIDLLPNSVSTEILIYRKTKVSIANCSFFIVWFLMFLKR